MSKLFSISGFTEPTAKGNITIKVAITDGFATSATPHYILSTPDAVKKHNLKVGQDITDVVKDFSVETSHMEVVDEATGEAKELTFKWLVP